MVHKFCCFTLIALGCTGFQLFGATQSAAPESGVPTQQLVEATAEMPVILEPTAKSTAKNFTSLRIGCIDTMKVMSGTKKGKEITSELEKRQKELADDLQSKEKKLKQKMEELKAKSSTMSAAAREKSENEILELRRDLETSAQTSEDMMRRTFERLMNELSKEVETVVTKIAKDGQFDLVFDVSSGRIVFASEKVMVTDQLTKALDEAYDRAHKEKAKKKTASAPVQATK